MTAGDSVHLSGLETHTYYTISDAAGNFYDATGTVVTGDSKYIAASTKNFTMPSANVTITTGYAAASVTIDGNVVTVYVQPGEEVTVTGRNESGNTGALRGTYIAITDNEGEVSYVAIDNSGVTPTATFEMPATGVASYDDNYYLVSVTGADSAITVTVNGEELDDPAAGLAVKASQTVTVVVKAELGGEFTYGGTTYVGGTSTDTLTLTVSSINADSTVKLS